MNDVTSVVLRDAILWTLYVVDGFAKGPRGVKALIGAAHDAGNPREAEDMLLSAATEATWDVLNEAG